MSREVTRGLVAAGVAIGCVLGAVIICAVTNNMGQVSGSAPLVAPTMNKLAVALGLSGLAAGFLLLWNQISTNGQGGSDGN